MCQSRPAAWPGLTNIPAVQKFRSSTGPKSASPERFTHQAMETIVKVAFLTAAVDVEFHDMWMTSDTWDELICLHFNLVNEYIGIF